MDKYEDMAREYRTNGAEYSWEFGLTVSEMLEEIACAFRFADSKREKNDPKPNPEIEEA